MNIIKTYGIKKTGNGKRFMIVADGQDMNNLNYASADFAKKKAKQFMEAYIAPIKRAGHIVTLIEQLNP